MQNRITHHDLMALADGELDSARAMAVLEFVTNHPEAARKALFQTQLREAIRRAAIADTPAMPEALAAAIQQLAAETAELVATSTESAAAKASTSAAASQPASSTHATEPLARIGGLSRWVPFAAAAVLVLATLVAIYTIGPGSSLPDSPNVAAASSMITPQQIAMFNKRHVGCTRSIEPLLNRDKFSGELREFSGQAEQYLLLSQSHRPALDLDKLGYQFAGAGECHIPSKHALHLIYAAKPETGRSDRLSLWMTRAEDVKFAGTPHLEKRKIYEIDTDGAHPMVLWQCGDVVYFLVGDGAKSVHDASTVLAFQNP